MRSEYTYSWKIASGIIQSLLQSSMGIEYITDSMHWTVDGIYFEVADCDEQIYAINIRPKRRVSNEL